MAALIAFNKAHHPSRVMISMNDMLLARVAFTVPAMSYQEGNSYHDHGVRVLPIQEKCFPISTENVLPTSTENVLAPK